MTEQTQPEKHQFLDGSPHLIRSIEALEEMEKELLLVPGQDQLLEQVRGQIKGVKLMLQQDVDHRTIASDLEHLSLKATALDPEMYIREMLRAKGRVHGIYIDEAAARLRRILGDKITPEVEQVLIGMTTRTLLADIAMVDCIRTFNLISGTMSPRIYDMLSDPINAMTKVAFGYMPELDAIDQFSMEEGWTYNQTIPLHDPESTEVRLYEAVVAGNRIVNIAVANGTWIERTVDKNNQIAIGIEMSHENPSYVSNDLKMIVPSAIACWRPASDDDIAADKYKKAYEYQTARMQEYTIHLEHSKRAEEEVKKEASPLILPDHAK